MDKKMKKYKKDYCEGCANKNTNLCEIHRDIKGDYKCPWYEPKGLGISLLIIILIEIVALMIIATIIGG